jgi:hypothetical protein
VVAGLRGLLDSVDNGLLIGLGGGGLVTFLHHVLPNCKLHAVELDPAVAKVAEQYFGLDNVSVSGYLTMHIGDGLKIGVEESGSEPSVAIPPGSLDFIAIDVDAKDSSVGMSCPPVAFLDASYLETLRTLLTDGGVLTINVSARDPEMLDLACRKVADIFPDVFLSHEDNEEDINVVVFASRNECSPAVHRFSSLKGLHSTTNTELQDISQRLLRWRPGSQKNAVRSSNGKRKKARGKGGKKR